MTVVHVRVHSDHAEVMFGESARIYRLARDHPAYEETLRALREAAAGERPVRVRFDAPYGDVIERVQVNKRR